METDWSSRQKIPLPTILIRNREEKLGVVFKNSAGYTKKYIGKDRDKIDNTTTDFINETFL